MKKNQIITFLLIFILVFLVVDPVLAGPGGYIAKGLFKTWWGKLLMIAIGIILLPLIIYIRMREFFAVRKCKKDLLKLSITNRDFLWLNLEKEIKNIFERVYHAWSKEDMELVSEYVSPWYWRNQQLIHLDRWKENDLQNISNLRKLGSIKPLYLEMTAENNFENSKIAFSVTAETEDYLINRSTGEVVEGKKGFESDEKVWIFEYTEGKWLLDDIREGNLSLAFAKLPNVIPSSLSTSPIAHNGRV